VLSFFGWSGFGKRIVRRRELIALVGSAAAIQPLGARAERLPERILYFPPKKRKADIQQNPMACK
jgi:hypothetical protein